MNINLIVPQYQSSYCIDECNYCGFNKNNKVISRTRLSDEYFEREIELLINLGHRTIEFVYSSDRYFSPEKIATRVEFVKEYGISKGLNIRVGLNSEPFDYKGYKMLKNAGLDFFVMWMETYDRARYSFWHGSKTPKSDFDTRYNTYATAIEAGITNYGMGILFGLSDWNADVNSLINHGKKLTEDFGVSPYIIGIPRIKRANCVILNDNFINVSDEDLSIAINKYKEAFPEAMIFYNTREDFEFNIQNIKNNDLFTIDCGTYPGYYLNPSIVEKDTEQFHTIQYERLEILQRLKEIGVNLRYDW